jgi:multiple sugar transport system permease protein
MDSIKRFAVKAGTLYIPLWFFAICTLFPLYWTLNTALKPEGDIVKSPIKYWPSSVTFQNFVYSWENVGFSQFFKNSVVVAVFTVLTVLICALFAGYALSRFSFRGKKGFMLLLLCTQFIPHAMLLIPFFLIFKQLGLTSNLTSLILTYATMQLPFNTILMSGFISNVPEQLEEAAMVDGCGRLKSVIYVVLPVLLPGIVATGAFTFIGAWNEFLFALMLISKNSLFTLPVGLSFMQGEFDIHYGALAAGSIIALIPAILLFMYVQRFLMSGLSHGAVKG